MLRPVRAAALALAVLLLGGACTVEEWRNADLQLDIVGSDWGGYDRARICVADVGNLEAALGAGKLGFTGLPADITADVTVDLLADDGATRLGRAGPVALSADEPWQRAAWIACDADTEDCAGCTASGDLAGETEASWLLAVRFQ